MFHTIFPLVFIVTKVLFAMTIIHIIIILVILVVTGSFTISMMIPFFRNDLSYHDPPFVHYNRDDLRCNINRPPIHDYSDNHHCVLRSQNHNPYRRNPCIFLYSSNFFHFVMTMSIVPFPTMAILLEIFTLLASLSFVIFIDNNCHRDDHPFLHHHLSRHNMRNACPSHGGLC